MKINGHFAEIQVISWQNREKRGTGVEDAMG